MGVTHTRQRQNPGTPEVANRLAELRQARGVAAAALARQVGVSRQTIYAIETGTYVPNTQVALCLARALSVPVEELFSLRLESAPPAAPVSADLLSAAPVAAQQPVRVCQVGERRVAIPAIASPYFLPEADGVVSRATRSGHAHLDLFGEPPSERRIVVAGCDPAIHVLCRLVEQSTGVQVIPAPASSRLALSWLSDEMVHLAGTHLRDPHTGEFNLPFVRRQFPSGGFKVVTFARWEEGLVLAAGNPKRIRGVEDLAVRGVTIVNREPGSGSRSLLDERLKAAGIAAARIAGYSRLAGGHLAAAYAVLTGTADACIATRSAARAFSLDFVPLHEERYDFVLRSAQATLPAVEALLDTLQRATLRRSLESLAGYDTSATGSLIA
jgi:putative molybdopterin biosynthesis protein